jgi:RND family efflux transporter MFP subunit
MNATPSVGRWWIVGLAALVTAGGASWYALTRGKPAFGGEPGPTPTDAKPAVSVEVASPRAGGAERVCVQPGTVEPFQSADLYAKASGFLVELNVDIGSAVKAGDVLARISVPEAEKQVQHDTADVTRAEARVDQMTAGVTTAEADLGAATAAVALAKADLTSKAASLAYRQKERDRMRDLAARNAIEARLADEQEDRYQAAVADELAARQAVTAATQKEAAAKARVAQANADLKYAAAEVATAKARREKSAVLLDYTVIRSPYTGVVTKRNFHPGDFIKSADAGGERVPVLAVERTDVMRVVVQVPDRFVPFVAPGAPAVVEIDALPGRVFKTAGGNAVVVSRSAAAEDPRTRMMRTEIDLPNPDGKLRRGMYGRVTLSLCSGSPSAVRVPSVALVGKAEGGKAAVRVVRGERVQLVPVTYGADNGEEAEILTGLTAQDRVVVRAAGPVDDGTTVAVR